ncbi:hypothetical protein BCR34DRAFT_585779 [Clohesyomyces aquaticus]|uniref:Protein kinase domain-containing protein n=1 Tax=Clohesyomyces aquaticus TaxID=1231657 RepID=A0A1Y1ZX81_9PLEO|nr:hypothetical protein BCR34DRAFT_585779 [Clohesyomyces aquaticus]
MARECPIEGENWPADYVILLTIGRGYGGEVLLAVSWENLNSGWYGGEGLLPMSSADVDNILNQVCAVKQYSTETDFVTPLGNIQAPKEIKSLQQLRHDDRKPCIRQMLESLLADFLRRHEAVPDALMCHAFIQIVEALRFFHGQNPPIIHLD